MNKEDSKYVTLIQAYIGRLSETTHQLLEAQVHIQELEAKIKTLEAKK